MSVCNCFLFHSLAIENRTEIILLKAFEGFTEETLHTLTPFFHLEQVFYRLPQNRSLLWSSMEENITQLR